MSHYTVAVFSNTPDGFDALLAPYNENNEEHYITEPLSEEDISQLHERHEALKKSNADNAALLKEIETFEDYVKWSNYAIDEDGVICRTYNPDALYDWYSLDSRAYEFDDCLVDEESLGDRLKDYDFTKPDLETDVNKLKETWRMYERFAAMTPEERKEHQSEYSSIWHPQYMIDRYKSEENYIFENTRIVPYCFITPDGQLHTQGHVGWFACDDSTADSFKAYYEDWIKYVTSDVNPYVSFVDCHI